ncbi:MAG TPA: hypothetical protein VGB37_06915, partial [Candidatus Lokiarchaeia archaeon]
VVAIKANLKSMNLKTNQDSSVPGSVGLYMSFMYSIFEYITKDLEIQEKKIAVVNREKIINK